MIGPGQVTLRCFSVRFLYSSFLYLDFSAVLMILFCRRQQKRFYRCNHCGGCRRYIGSIDSCFDNSLLSHGEVPLHVQEENETESN